MTNILIDDRGRHLKAYGYGRVALSLINGFSKVPGINVYVALPDALQKNKDSTITDEKFSYIQFSDLNKLDFSYSIAVCPPNCFSPLIENTFLYTMIDTSDLPTTWRDIIKAARGIIVPAQGSYNAFKKYFNFVYKLPLPINIGNVFVRRPNYRSEGVDKFSCIFVGTDSFRKGFDTLLSAFIEEFDQNEARLTIVSTETDGDRIFNKIIAELNKNRKIVDINLVTKPLTDNWLSRIYCRHDCFVTFTRGEGWGYPAMEAALCGLPVICPDGIASWEFLDSECNFKSKSSVTLIDEATHVSAAGWIKEYGGNGITYVDTSIDEARKALRTAFSQKDSLAKIGERSSELIKLDCDFNSFVERLILLNDDLLRRVQNVET